MVASGGLLGVAGAVLTKGGASEFASPNDEGVFEQTAFLQVLNEGGGWGVGVDALLFELGEKVAVLVPSGMHELNEAGPAFQKAAGGQAIVGEGSAFAGTSGP